MGKAKVVSDEEIIASLLTSGSLRAAAFSVGISERTLYNRMNDGDFQVKYKSAKADLIRGVVFNLNRQLQAAVDTVVQVMQDENNNAAVRLQAAQTILNNAGKLSQRLQSNEDAVATQIVSNNWEL